MALATVILCPPVKTANKTPAVSKAIVSCCPLSFLSCFAAKFSAQNRGTILTSPFLILAYSYDSLKKSITKSEKGFPAL